MRCFKRCCWPAVACLAIAVGTPAFAEANLVLTWITNSSVKVEQIVGEADYEDAAKGINTPTTSRTVSRFHVLGSGLGYSFEHDGKMIVLFGDTISEDTSNLNYHAADPIAWSTSTNAEAGLLLNYYTNADGLPLFVQPPGIKMGPFDVPNCGFSLNHQIYLLCNTGSDTSNPDNPQWSDYSIIVSFDETNLTFATNRVISMLNTNLDSRSLRQGHFIDNSPHVFGTNVFIFGLGEYRASDVYLQVVPTNDFLSGVGTRYFAGMTNGEPKWDDFESNAVPVVVDNPTNGPAWPNDFPTAGNVSVIYSTNLDLWLMTYDGGRQKPRTRGIHFCYAPEPWGPWSTPQLIFNETRDHAAGVFIHEPGLIPDDGLDGPVIGFNDPTNTAGGAFAAIMYERFTTISSNILTIYYSLSTWNPYTVVRMRSEFSITRPPILRIASSADSSDGVTLSWSAPTNDSFQVDYSIVLPPTWTTFPGVVTSTDGTFRFTDDGSHSGGLSPFRFYRIKSQP